MDAKFDENKYCKHGNNKQAKLQFCLDENMPFCPLCIKKHIGHRFESVEEIGLKLKEFLEKKIEAATKANADSEEEKIIKGGQKHIQEQYEEIVSVFDNAKKKVCEFIDEVVGKEKEKVQNILEEINKFELQRQESQKQFKDNIANLQKELNDLCQHSDNLQNEFLEIYETYKKYKQNFEEPDKSKIVSPVPSPKVENNEALQLLVNKAKSYKNVIKPEYFQQCIKSLHDSLLGLNKTKSMQTTYPLLLSSESFAHKINLFNLRDLTNKEVNLFIEQEPFSIPYNSFLCEKEGSVYIIGGTRDTKKYLDTVYNYSTLQERMIRLPNLNVPRSEHAAVFVENSLICAGGRDETGYLNSCEELDLHENNIKWMLWKFNLTEKKSSITLCAFATPPLLDPELMEKREYSLYCIGGQAKGVFLDTIEKIVLSGVEGWKKIIIQQNDFGKRIGSASIQISKGEILLLGGCISRSEESDENFIFNTNDCERTNGMVRSRRLPGNFVCTSLERV